MDILNEGDNQKEDSPFKTRLDESCQCKICWSNEQTIENPLLNSCNCNGSMRYIHYKCLQHWLKQKMIRKEVEMEQGGKVVTFAWKSFECEICKQSYPFTFHNKGKQYRLADYVDEDIPAQGSGQPYILMESLTFEKNSSRIIQLIKPS